MPFGWIEEGINKAREAIGQVVEQVRETVTGKVGRVKETVVDKAGRAREVKDRKIEQAKSTVTQKIGSVRRAIEEKGRGLERAISEDLERAGATAGEARRAIERTAERVVRAKRDVAGGVGNRVSVTVSAGERIIVGKVAEAKRGAWEKVDRVKDATVRADRTVEEFLGQKVEGAGEVLGGLRVIAGQTIGNLHQTKADAVDDMWAKKQALARNTRDQVVNIGNRIIEFKHFVGAGIAGLLGFAPDERVKLSEKEKEALIKTYGYEEALLRIQELEYLLQAQEEGWLRELEELMQLQEQYAMLKHEYGAIGEIPFEEIPIEEIKAIQRRRRMALILIPIIIITIIIGYMIYRRRKGQ